jgi:hypothetical protein
MIHGLRGQQFERVIFQKLRLSCKSRDNCVVIDDDYVILIENFVVDVTAACFHEGSLHGNMVSYA